MSDQNTPPPSPEWKAKFVEFINAKVKEAGRCPECKELAITVADQIVSPIRLEGGNFQLGGPIYPQIMLVCTNCGNTRYFNAVIAKAFEGGT